MSVCVAGAIDAAGLPLGGEVCDCAVGKASIIQMAVAMTTRSAACPRRKSMVIYFSLDCVKGENARPPTAFALPAMLPSSWWEYPTTGRGAPYDLTAPPPPRPHSATRGGHHD